MPPAAPVPHVCVRYPHRRRLTLIERLARWLAARRAPVAAAALVEHAGTAANLDGPVLVLDEAAASNATFPVRIITPGWGTSGYYPAEVIERDGPAAFPAGTHMYFDHPTMSEASERPERSLRDLAGVLATDARWIPEHPFGPGLYADATPFDAYRPVLTEMAPHIGVSIRATGRAHHGEAEGRIGRIVDAIERGLSVDFVTGAGRGGEILPLLEAARAATHQEADRTFNDIRQLLTSHLEGEYDADDRWTWVRDLTDTWVVWEDSGSGAPDPGLYQATYEISDGGEVTLGTPVKVQARTEYVPVTDGDQPPAPPAAPAATDPLEEGTNMTTPATGAPRGNQATPTADELAEAQRERDEARREALGYRVRDAARALLAERSDVPAAARDRIATAISIDAVTADGAINDTALAEAVTKAADAEVAYLAEAGRPAARAPKRAGVTNDSAVLDEGGKPDPDALAGRFATVFGLSESAAAHAARR